MMAVWSNTALSTIETQFGRFDAEFYKPEFLDTDRILSAIDGVKLRDVANKIDVGHVGPMVRHYSETEMSFSIRKPLSGLLCSRRSWRFEIGNTRSSN